MDKTALDMPLVSVLMTSYNREKFIAQAIESVLASTYVDFELIIVDDGSKDSTVEIAKRYALKDARVKVFVNKNNLGDYPNRNQAASYAQGKYLKYVDADDLIYPWGLELLVQMMERFPEAGWGLCSLEQDRERPFPILLSPPQAYAYHYQGPGLFHKAPLSSIINREVFQAVGGFSPIRMAGDFDMWHKLALSQNVLLMPHGMVWYREHAEQEMKDFHRYILTYEAIKINYLSRPDCPLSPVVIKSIIKGHRNLVRKELIKSILHFNYSNFSSAYKRLIAFRAVT
jgi:glycosyltransferase involved in cell wall biosynthesis